MDMTSLAKAGMRGLSSGLRTGASARPRTSRVRPTCETLEGRRLLTGGITEFGGPFSAPVDMIKGRDGNFWVLNAGTEGDSTLVVMFPDATIRATYSVPTPNAWANSLAAGSDGNVWFTESGAGKIGKVTPAGVFTEYALPSVLKDYHLGPEPFTVTPSPTDIVAGADGALWFVEQATNAIGRITTDGSLTTVDATDQQPEGLAVGPDKAIWFTNSTFDGSVDRLNGDGTISRHLLPTTFSWPTAMAVGPDGALYVVQGFRNGIARVSADGAATEIAIHADLGSLQALTFDDAGNLWVTGGNGSIARVSPDGSASVVRNDATGDASFGSVIVGFDHALWFIDAGTDKIGRLDPTTVPAPDPNTHTLSGASSFNPNVGTTSPNELAGDFATFYDSSPAGRATDYAATIAWGDGTSSPGVIHAADGVGFVVGGSHVYAAAGSYDVTVAVAAADPALVTIPGRLTLTSSFGVGSPNGIWNNAGGGGVGGGLPPIAFNTRGAVPPPAPVSLAAGSTPSAVRLTILKAGSGGASLHAPRSNPLSGAARSTHTKTAAGAAGQHKIKTPRIPATTHKVAVQHGKTVPKAGLHARIRGKV